METRENLEIDLKRMFIVLWSNLWIILLVGVLVAALALGYAWLTITPTYSATTQLYVNNNYPDSPGYSSSQLAAAQSLADTYIIVMRSRPVLDEVSKQTNLGYTYGQLRGMISAGSVNDTEIFQVTVTNTNYQHAAMIANAIADVLPKQLPKVVDTASVRVVEYAVENPNPVGPSYPKYAMLGAAAGALLTAMVIIVAELMDTTINSEEYLSHVYKEYPLLAVVPGAESSKSSYKGYYKGYYAADPKPKDKKKAKGEEKKDTPAQQTEKGGAEK